MSAMTKSAKTKSIKKRTTTGATASLDHHSDGVKVFDLNNIRVGIYRSGKRWIAQSMEIDYVAQGDDVKSVKQAFENGLTATINQHLKMFGNADKLLRFAPKSVRLDVMNRFFTDPDSIDATFSQISIHSALVGINYLQVA